MVKKKSGRTLNPADAHRKAMRQKEIKKNKAERKRVRTLVMVHKDTSKLEEEIARYRTLDREKRLDKNGKAKLKDLDDKFKKILETKKAHGVNLQKEKPITKDHVPVYFHPTLNPSGLPPPGVVKSDEESLEEDDSGSESSDDSEAEAKQESDEDIPLPPGSPPPKKEESDDELPELPPGPPPKKEESDDELPELPPGPPPNPNISYSHSTRLARPSPPPPPPFGFNHQVSPFPPPPGAFLFNGPLGSPNHQRPNVRPPPLPSPAFAPGIGPNPFSAPPPAPMHSIQGQGYPVRPLDVPHPRPPPFSSQVSHYGPPPQIPGGNNNMSSRTFSHQTMTNNVQSAKTYTAANAVTATPVIQAAPQVRNLQKELTTLVPSALLRKKAAASKPKVARPIVNAAPNIDDGSTDEPSTTAPTKRTASTAIPLLQEQQKSLEVDSPQLNGTSVTPSPAKKAKKKKADEYEKFMSEMQDLL